ncbi:MAG: hypothetical protein LBU79_09300, partial [Planctomycetota bacterium]|nr:hypothetical protein [Planctomycetota bacterium]
MPVKRFLRFYLPFLLLGVIILVGLCLAFPGCADMPILDPPPGEEAPPGSAAVAFGPYLTSADGRQPMFRFIANRRVVAGLQNLDRSDRRVNRQGAFSLFHTLAIPEIDSAQPQRYQLWLDDQSGGVYRLQGLPPYGQAVTLAFAGGQADPERLQATGVNLRLVAPQATVFVSPPFAGELPERSEDWSSRFLGPLGNVIDFGPLWFVPGSGLPAQLYPEHNDEGGYWKRDVGVIRLIAIDARAFSFPSSTQAVLARLERDLDPQRRQRAWTVVVLSRPAFDARVGDGRILEALGDRLETGGVDLVIAGGGQGYLRTRPFSVSGVGGTRYIALADQPASSLPEPREYVAALSNQPHVAGLWADEGNLEWRVIGPGGVPLDSLTLDYDRRPLEASLSKWDILVDAQASLTLQKELLRLTRQAARAVPNPSANLLLPLYFVNPST